jgi:prepilin-type N-terminal cleavage/methylation domain-containing protein
MSDFPKDKYKAFTLIELLVVIATIGLLSSVVLVSLKGTRGKAQIAKGLDFSNSIQNVLGVDAVGIWNFETIETGNIVLDGSGYGNHGTVNGATLVAGMEQLGNALSFDGVNDYVGIINESNFDMTTNLTLEAWINIDGGATVNSGIIEKYEAYQIMFQNSANKIFYRRSIVGDLYPTWQESNTVISRGQWHHLVMTYDATQLKLYINGSIDKITNLSGSLNNSVYPVRIGYSYTTPSYAKGIIDEVRIYNQALTTAQIKSQYHAGLDRLLVKGLISGEEYKQRLVKD